MGDLLGGEMGSPKISSSLFETKKILPTTGSKLSCLNFEMPLLMRRGFIASLPIISLFIFFDSGPKI